jgi:hypothetical protein
MHCIRRKPPNPFIDLSLRKDCIDLLKVLDYLVEGHSGRDCWNSTFLTGVRQGLKLTIGEVSADFGENGFSGQVRSLNDWSKHLKTKIKKNSKFNLGV